MNKPDVLEFSQNAEERLHVLWNDIEKGDYKHGSYTTFQIRDPKLRTINKACVRDRILHQAIFTKLEPIFDSGFIYDSYSSRKGKGMLAMVERFESFANRVSNGNRRAVWVMKCDVRKFFDSVDHEILKQRIVAKISSPDALNLISEVLRSFSTGSGSPLPLGEGLGVRGIPLGNITSQLFSNVYLNLLDQYMKRRVKAEFYLRYADDIVVMADRKEELFVRLEQIKIFLQNSLGLQLHPDKISIRTWRQGVDILGYISYPNYREIRTKTKKRIRHAVRAKKWLEREGFIALEKLQETIASYRGRIKHAWSRNLAEFLDLC